jgi:hypothetical protein
MGNFYTNVALRGCPAGGAERLLRELGREAFVAEVGDWTVVYDRECEKQDTAILAALAGRLAAELRAIALAVLNHDDDILWLHLYKGAALVAEYANRDGPRTRVRALCQALGCPSAASEVWLLLRRPFVFQMERHQQLAAALGLPEASVGSGFDYISRGDLPKGVTREALKTVRSAGG